VRGGELGACIGRQAHWAPRLSKPEIVLWRACGHRSSNAGPVTTFLVHRASDALISAGVSDMPDAGSQATDRVMETLQAVAWSIASASVQAADAALAALGEFRASRHTKAADATIVLLPAVLSAALAVRSLPEPLALDLGALASSSGHSTEVRLPAIGTATLAFWLHASVLALGADGHRSEHVCRAAKRAFLHLVCAAAESALLGKSYLKGLGAPNFSVSTPIQTAVPIVTLFAESVQRALRSLEATLMSSDAGRVSIEAAVRSAVRLLRASANGVSSPSKPRRKCSHFTVASAASVDGSTSAFVDMLFDAWADAALASIPTQPRPSCQTTARSLYVYRLLRPTFKGTACALLLERLYVCVLSLTAGGREGRSLVRSLLETLEGIARRASEVELTAFPQLFWAAAGVLHAADVSGCSTDPPEAFSGRDALLAPALRLLNAVIRGIDVVDPLARDVILATMPPQWRRDFPGLQSLVVRGVGRPNGAHEAALAVLEAISAAPLSFLASRRLPGADMEKYSDAAGNCEVRDGGSIRTADDANLLHEPWFAGRCGPVGFTRERRESLLLVAGVLPWLVESRMHVARSSHGIHVHAAPTSDAVRCGLAARLAERCRRCAALAMEPAARLGDDIQEKVFAVDICGEMPEAMARRGGMHVANMDTDGASAGVTSPGTVGEPACGAELCCDQASYAKADQAEALRRLARALSGYAEGMYPHPRDLLRAVCPPLAKASLPDLGADVLCVLTRCASQFSQPGPWDVSGAASGAVESKVRSTLPLVALNSAALFVASVEVAGSRATSIHKYPEGLCRTLHAICTHAHSDPGGCGGRRKILDADGCAWGASRDNNLETSRAVAEVARGILRRVLAMCGA
jgi:hypothetical protein